MKDLFLTLAFGLILGVLILILVYWIVPKINASEVSAQCIRYQFMLARHEEGMNQLLQQGWQLYGSPACDRFSCYQALTRQTVCNNSGG